LSSSPLKLVSWKTDIKKAMSSINLIELLTQSAGFFVGCCAMHLSLRPVVRFIIILAVHHTHVTSFIASVILRRFVVFQSLSRSIVVTGETLREIPAAAVSCGTVMDCGGLPYK